MTVAKLIALLQNMPQGAEVMILDGFNGAGVPREINVPPRRRIVAQEHEDECADCEGRVGETVVVMGYGSY